MDSYGDIDWLSFNSFAKNPDHRSKPSLLRIKSTDHACQRILDLLDSDHDSNPLPPPPQPEQRRGRTLGAKPNGRMVESPKTKPKMFEEKNDDAIRPVIRSRTKRTALDFSDCNGDDNDENPVGPVSKAKTKPSSTITYSDYMKERGNDTNGNKTPVKSAEIFVPKKNPITPEEYSKKMVFQVIYGRHKPQKKNKEWTFDGFVLIKPEAIILYKCSGTIEGRTSRIGDNIPRFFSSGTRLVIGSWECELSDQVDDVEEFERGTFFAPDDIDV